MQRIRKAYMQTMSTENEGEIIKNDRKNEGSSAVFPISSPPDANLADLWFVLLSSHNSVFTVCSMYVKCPRKLPKLQPVLEAEPQSSPLVGQGEFGMGGGCERGDVYLFSFLSAFLLRSWPLFRPI